ncbi:MAG: hypothetical protein QNJ00_05435 [Woeseiaceae bacterium]|nr:hypothetical protein [Woeseiaceae bacterium]
MAGRTTLEYQGQLDALGPTLLPQEIERAEEESADLIHSNPNCCY